MVTFDLMFGIMYAQLFLAVALFFFVQALVLFARERIDDIGDWFVYRGTWIAIVIQLLFMLVVGALVLYTPTDSTIVSHAVLLIIMNTAWFVSLRLAFEFADYIYSRRESSVN